MRIAMLTTADNPFDPFEDYDEWDSFDRAQGYHTASYLARIACTSDELSDAENNSEIESAIDEIISLNLSGNYKKIVKNI